MLTFVALFFVLFQDARQDSVPVDTSKIYIPVETSHQKSFLSDSLHRWSTNLDVYEWMERTPGFITFRQNSFGRFSGYSSVFSEFGSVAWEGQPLKNPISHQQRLELLPFFEFQKMASPDNSFSNLNFSEQEIGLIKPRTEFNYQQSEYKMRTLQARFSRNLTSRLGLDFSVSGEDETGQYQHQVLRGFNTRNKIWYRFENVEVGARMLYAVDRNDENDGIDIENPVFFPFNRFIAQPRDIGHQRNKDAYYSAYLKGKTPWQFLPELKANAWIRNNGQRYHDSQDTLAITSRTVGFNTSTQLYSKFLSISPRIESQTTQFLDGSQLSRNGLSTLDLASTIRLGLNRVEVNGDFSISSRSDGFAGYQSLVSGEIDTRFINLIGGVARIQSIPSPLSLYHQGTSFSSNSNLSPEKENRVFVRGSVSIAKSKISFGGRLSNFVDRVGISADSIFANLPNHTEIHGFVSFERNSEHLEILASTDIQQITSSGNENSPLFDDVLRLWVKGGIWYKGYAFDKATYLKAGVFGWWSPLAYSGYSYIPIVGMWNLPFEELYNPGWARLDIDFSARIRSVFLVARLENALNGLGQLGYFQTNNYPMPGRRFRLGIRWVLRN